jgi:hypothetical protein
MQIVAHSGKLQGISMQMGKTAGYHYSIEVVPRSFPDMIARVDSWLARSRLCAEVGSPREASGTNARSQYLAMCVGSSQAA